MSELIAESYAQIDIPRILRPIGGRLALVLEIVADRRFHINTETIHQIETDAQAQIDRPQSAVGRDLAGLGRNESPVLVQFGRSARRQGELGHRSAREIDVEAASVEYRIVDRQRNTQIVQSLAITIVECALDLGI